MSAERMTHQLPDFWPYRERSERVDVGSLQFHVQRFGPGAPNCLLLHGTGASVHSWTGLLPEFERRGLSGLAVDLPGHGFTATPSDADLSIDGVASAVAALLETLDVHPRIGIGHSAGVAVLAAMDLQGRTPLDHLVSINAALLPLGGPAGWLFAPLARIGAGTRWLPDLIARRARDGRQVRRLIDSTGSTIDELSMRCYTALLTDPAHVRGVIRLMAHWRLDRLAPRLDSLSSSVHLIAADGDRTIPLRDSYRLKALWPSARHDVLPGLGHLAHEEAPTLVADLIVDEISRQGLLDNASPDASEPAEPAEPARPIAHPERRRA